MRRQSACARSCSTLPRRFAIDPGGTARAAVLVPLHERAGSSCVVFTQRPRDLPRHAGQVSFPGGRVDDADVDLIATALREAHEEIGLPPGAVTILGALTPLHVHVSGFAVYPVVGAIERPPVWVPAAGEVEDVIELTVAELAASYARAVVLRRRASGERRRLPPESARSGARPPTCSSTCWAGSSCSR